MLRLCCLALALIVLGPASPALCQVKLRWKFKDGDTFFVEEKSHTRQENKIRDSLEVQELDQTKVSRFKVLKAAADGSLVLQQRIQAIKATAQGTGKEADVSALKLLERATFRITLDARQRLEEVSGYRGLLDTLTDKVPV